MNKGRLAYQLTVKDYLSQTDGKCYLWTFTLENVVELADFRDMWRKLQIYLVRHVKYHGIRVFEVHPGRHGYHVHVLTSQYFNVRLVRKVCSACGWGRVRVLLFIESVSGYIAKHLQKEREGCLKGVRLWGPVNLNGAYTRQKDVECCGGVGDVYRGLEDDTIKHFFPHFNSMSKRCQHEAKLHIATRQFYLGAV